MSRGVLLSQVDLHGLHVEEALQVLEQHLLSLGGLGCPGGVLLQVRQMHLPRTLSMINLHTLNSCVLATPVPGFFCAMPFLFNPVSLQVITGIGKHSTNGRPKILPAVIRYLSDAGHRFSEAVGNSGIIDVFIGGQRRLL
jgi:hypothetical protein